LSGYPFAANPLSGLWYPPGWLILLAPLPFGFNLLIGIHLVWAGIGLYFLMRSEGLRFASSLFSGLAFALLPKLFAHYGAGHVTLLYAISWTPWLLYSQQRYVLQSKEKKFQIPPGLILGMIFLADVRWGAFALIVWWVYALAHNNRSRKKLVLQLAVQSVLGLFFAAPLLIPLIEYSQLSTRSILDVEDVLVYSVPFFNSVGLIFPNITGLHEWVLYSGGIVLLLALTSLIARRWKRTRLFWMGLFLISVIIALGSAVPGSKIFAGLPLVSLFRVPSRALFLTGLSLAALAGFGVETLVYSPGVEISRKINIILVVTLGFSLSLSVGIYALQGSIPEAMVWGSIGLFLSYVWIWLGMNVKKIPINLWLTGIFMLALLDLVNVDLHSFQGKPGSEILAEGKAVAQYISSQSGIFRTYSPSYSIPQQTAGIYGIELADGVDPLQHADYVSFMEKASGVPNKRYSVTVPPFEKGDPKSDNSSSVPDSGQLGLLNVRYVVSEFELRAQGLRLNKKIQDTYIYENLNFMPRAWMGGNSGKINSASQVEMVELMPNQMIFSASGPGLLTVSQINYPGWQVSVDGIEGKVLTRYGFLMGVDLPPGLHEIKFTFKPSSIAIGIVFLVVGLVGLTISFARSKQDFIPQI
jgi:hypothetical protein